MTYSKRDLRRPISICCGEIEDELSRGELIAYRWHSRELLTMSPDGSPRISRIRFCPYCGSDVVKHSIAHIVGWFYNDYDILGEEGKAHSQIRHYDEWQLEGFDHRLLRAWDREFGVEGIRRPPLHRLLGCCGGCCIACDARAEPPPKQSDARAPPPTARAARPCIPSGCTHRFAWVGCIATQPPQEGECTDPQLEGFKERFIKDWDQQVEGFERRFYTACKREKEGGERPWRL